MTVIHPDLHIAWWRSPLAIPLGVMAVLWTFVPALLHSAPPLDVVESAMWGREWVVGTYKHPAMPAWFIEAGRYLDGGSVGWPAYFASQLFNVATLVVTYLLARDVADERVARASLLALLGVEYFSWRSVEFNHTIAQMPFWVASVWCAWRALEGRGLVWWLALGAAGALGLYAKLSNAMLLIVIAGWILATPRGRATLATPGPWLGGLLFAVLCLPMARWVVASGLQPLDYASTRGREQSGLATVLFPVNAALQAAPIVLALGLAGFFTRGALSTTQLDQTRSNRTFLWVLALAPPLLSVLSALAGGSGVRASWMAPALPLLTVLLISHYQRRLTDQVLANLGRIGLGLAVFIPLGYAAALPLMTAFSSAPPLRVLWPQAEIARSLSAAWRAETGKPLKIVAGTSWAAGLVGIDHPDHPSILTEGNLSWSPWITPDRLRRDGALVVWTEGRGSIASPAPAQLIAGQTAKEISFAMPGRPAGQRVVVKYVILRPE